MGAPIVIPRLIQAPSTLGVGGSMEPVDGVHKVIGPFVLTWTNQPTSEGYTLDFTPLASLGFTGPITAYCDNSNSNNEVGLSISATRGYTVKFYGTSQPTGTPMMGYATLLLPQPAILQVFTLQTNTTGFTKLWFTNYLIKGNLIWNV